MAKKRQKIGETELYKVSINWSWPICSQASQAAARAGKEGTGDRAAGSPAPAAVLSQYNMSDDDTGNEGANDNGIDDEAADNDGLDDGLTNDESGEGGAGARIDGTPDSRARAPTTMASTMRQPTTTASIVKRRWCPY